MFDSTKYRVIPLSGIGRMGDQNRVFSVGTNDTLSIASSEGYFDDYLNVKNTDRDERQWFDGDFILLQTEVDETTMRYDFMQVVLIPGATENLDSYKLIPGTNFPEFYANETLAIPASFETDEVGTIEVFLPFEAQLQVTEVIVSKTIAGTDDGIVKIQDKSGNDMISGGVTIPQSSVVGAMVADTLDQFNTVLAGTSFKIVTSKATPGGRVLIQIQLVKSNPRMEIENSLSIIPVSFETDEIGSINIFFPYACQINEVVACVTKTIASTDNGLISLLNSSGDRMENATDVPISADATVGEVFAFVPTTNNIVAAGDYFTVETTKATKGGRVILDVQVSRM